MAKVNFTAGRISVHACELGKSQSFLWDRAAPGLGLRATAAGAKSYIFQAKLNGIAIRITIGNPATWPIDKAQAEARRLKTQIDGGHDPRQVRSDDLIAKQEARDTKARKVAATELEAKRATLTLGEVWPEYLSARRSKWSDSHYADHVAMAAPGGEKKKRGRGETIPGPLAALLPYPLAAITGDRLAAWLDVESKTRPTAAALAFRMLRALIRWSEEISAYQGLVPADVYNARKVRDSLPKSLTKHGDCLQREQLPAWFKAVRGIINPVASAYLQALLLTGARREEMAGLRWVDVDFQWRTLTIRDKVEGVRVIPLPRYLANLIAVLPRRNEWVFSSPTAAGGRIAEPRYCHGAALATAGLPHLSIHGLRRSFGTLCEWVEVPSGISAQIMGHKPSALAEKYYRRRPIDLLRKWHDQIEGWILEQGTIRFDPVGIEPIAVNSS